MRPGRATRGRSLKSVWHETVVSQTATTRTGDYVYCGYDFKPALPPAMPACFAAKFVSVGMS